ncbi:hypothetical protein [Arthrobacter alkaliphilus]|uniref:hypothetical protein n=1 Tax=Arthrobacter alkaliphilus TaxID=369936 RepID=UPI001F3D30A6|nr:hypothetical protein [Arthrobacter alkaliphilus]
MSMYFREIRDFLGSREVLDLELIHKLEPGPIPGDDDLASAINLTRLVHEQFVAFGTDGSQRIDNAESREVLRALRRVLSRHATSFEVPWRDFTSFRTHWIAEGCAGTGGWQARRDLLEKYFRPVFETLETAEEQQFRAELAESVSPHSAIGWPLVDEEIEALRQRFRTAATPQDYRDVGNRSEAVLEALSAIVYDADEHLAPGETEPPVDKTNIRIEAYANKELQGGANEHLRGLAKKASAMAHDVKHSPTGSRRDAGIIADSVILLANILRRLKEAF